MQDSYYDDEYLETRVLTAPPQQLHLMVLEGAIRSARQGKLALEEQNFELAHARLNHSREFVTELMTGLNPEHQPEMIDSLVRLFTYVYRNLALADMEHDLQAIDSAVRILEYHRETWVELLQTMGGNQAPATEEQTPTDTLDLLGGTETFTWEG